MLIDRKKRRNEGQKMWPILPSWLLTSQHYVWNDGDGYCKVFLQVWLKQNKSEFKCNILE